jgi:hypothetical protein
MREGSRINSLLIADHVIQHSWIENQIRHDLEIKGRDGQNEVARARRALPCA